MKHQREHWASRVGFIMAAIGSAIGLGTLWKFPYVKGENGGGLFVLIYLVCTVLIGIPVFIAELMIGRKAQRGAVGVFMGLAPQSRNWRLIGWLAVASPLLILSYYCVVAGWGLNYVFLSLNQFAYGRSPEEVKGVFETLYHSGDVTLFFQIIFLLMTFGVVFQGIQKGIEYWSRVMTSALLVMLVCLAIYSFTLEGFSEAFHFVFYPDVSKLKPSGVLQALGLAFFTLSLGQGVMLTYGSYMKRSEDIPKTSIIVSLSVVLVSILAALMIFPIIFTFGIAPDQKEGLVFKTLPVLFEQLPGGIVIGTVFFILFVFTALTSSIALLEVIVANLIDLYDWTRKKAAMIATAAVFVLGLPSALSGTTWLFPNWPQMYHKTFFVTIDDLVNAWILPIGAFFTAIFVGWFLNKPLMRIEFASGTAYAKFFSVWHFFVRWIVPVGIFLVLLQEAGIIDIDRIFGLGPVNQ
jgi:neurotransmitter:Na+ symporter, NSS family